MSGRFSWASLLFDKHPATGPDRKRAILRSIFWCCLLASIGLRDLPSQPLPEVPVLNAEPTWTAGTTNTLSWTAATSATAYYLEWGTNPSFTPQAGNSDWTAATSYTATDLADSQTYFFHVKCRDASAAESAWSNATSSTQDATPPSAPETPTDEGTTWPARSARFFWTAATDTGSGVASYDLQVGTSPGGSNVLNANVGNVLTHAVTGADNQTLQARVRTRDNAGNIGAWSGNSDGITIHVSPAPTATMPLQRCGLGFLQCAAYSPNGKHIVTGGGIGAVLWDAATGNPVRILSAPGHYVRSVAFSPDGTKVLTGSNDWTAQLWDAATGAEIRTFSGHTGAVYSVAFSADGTKILTGGSDWTAQLWDAATGTEIRTFSGHTGPVYSVAFSPDGTKVLTGSWDNTAKLWDAATGAEIHTFEGHTSLVCSVAFSPNGTKILTGSEDLTAKLWDVATGAELRTFSGHGATVASVAFSPDGTKVLTAANTTAKLWDAGTGAEIRAFSWHTTDRVGSVAFSPDGTEILTAGDAAAKLWDAGTGAEIRTFSGHTGAVYSVAFSPDGTRILTGGGYDSTAKLWDAATGAEIRTFSGHTSVVYATVFSLDGTKVLTGSNDSTAKLWDAATGTVIRTFPGHTSLVWSVAFSPDGTKVLTGSWDRTAKLWDTASGAEIRTFSGHAGWVTSVAFSPDGTMILTGSYDHTAKLWDAATGAEIRTFSGHTSYVYSVAFSPDGTKILTGSDDATAKLWDAATGAVIRTFSGHASCAVSVAFSPDGSKVFTGSWDRTAKLWDAASGTELGVFSGHTDCVASVAFSPDGTKVLTGSTDGTAKVWELSPPRAVIVAGGGNYVGNGIAQQTEDLVAYSYKVLKARGYESANIRYLTAFGPADPTSPTLPFRDADGDGLNDVDGWATLETLREAVTGSFAAGSGRLLILFVDHGNRTEGFTAFRVNETQALLTTTLDGWLDDLQTSHSVDVTLVVDCCYSGQFVADCRETSASLPAGRKRLVLASTSANAEAVFLPPPDMTSFIYQFLGSAYMGNSVGEAWRAGKRFFEEFPVANQSPQMDDGTTGTGRADKEFFGATWAYGVHSTNDVNRFFPAFESWTTNTVVTPGTSVTLWARTLPGQNPLDVVAVVRPPAPTVISGDPVTNLPHVALRRNAGDPRLWEVTTSSVFASLGAYVVSFTARFEYERHSNPVFTRVTVSEGVDPDATPIRAILAVGEGGSSSLDSAFEGLGAYAYGVYLARFQDNGGVHHPEWIEYLTST